MLSTLTICRAAAALFYDGFFTRPDTPEGRQLSLRTFRFHFSMFAEAEYRICQRTPVIARADHFNIAADFTFVAKQQSNSVAAMAEVKPQRRSGGKAGLPCSPYTISGSGESARESSTRPASQLARRTPCGA